MNAKMEDVASVITSCLLTSKHGNTLQGLQKDYRLLEDRSIPFQSLGFSTLEAFMQRVPNVRLTRRGGEMWAEAIPTEESAHIAGLVAGQKAAKSRRRPQRSRHIPPRRPHVMSRNFQSFDSSQMRNRSSWNTGTTSNRGSSNNMMSNSAARPLMQQQVRPPLVSVPKSPPSKPRYNSSAKAQTASLSSRMLERKIQPDHYLDYAEHCRPQPGSLKPINKPIIAEVPRAIKSEPPAVLSTPPITPNIPAPVERWIPEGFTSRLEPARVPSVTQESASIAPPSVPSTPTSVLSTPPSVPPPSVSPPMLVQQTLARKRLCDRLNIPKPNNQFNSIVTNGNNGIQVTFENNDGGRVDRPITSTSTVLDPRDELKELVRNLHLQEPIYKTSPIGKSGHESSIFGQVLIGSMKFSSYPNEAKTEKDAEILSALRAIDELKKEHNSKFALRLTDDKKLIKDRILAIVDQHNGVFVHKISAFYRELHKESLSDDWIKDLEKWTEVTMEKGVDKTILRRLIPSNDKVPALPSPKVDKVLLNPIGKIEPGLLELPAENEWVVFVTAVISTVEIWVRLVGEDYSNKFDTIPYEMEQHYTSSLVPVTETIEIGGYYALKEDEHWHRVRVIDYDPSTGDAGVFFIDIGDEETVCESQLLPLDRKFCLLPAQAMRIALEGLEYLADCTSTIPRIEKYLIDGIFYAKDSSRTITDDGPFATVVLYDTNSDDDVNFNEVISKKIIHQLIMEVPQLDNEGRVTEVHVCHVDEVGDVFVHVKSDRMDFFVKELNRLTKHGFTEKDIEKSAVKQIDRSKVYFAKCPTSNNWYRVKIIDYSDESRSLKLFLIDFGRTVIVDVKNILQLSVLSPFLAKFPAQAIQVRLHNVDLSIIDKKLLARLVELAPPQELLLAKVIKPGYRGSPPTVELYKRIEPDNVLIAINNTLAIERELSQTNGDGNNNVRPRKRLERTNSRAYTEPEEVAKALKPPLISKIGEFFDVHVTMAANPSNFTVQPYRLKLALQTMMAELQEACAAYVGPYPSLESIGEGRLYAAKHTDNNWYRVCVSNIINEHMVTVYFCDYGDVTIITLDKLQRLQKQFFDLPYMAVKARLIGIQPTNMDWAVEDAVRFQELVVERDFVAVVVESAPDKHSPGDTVLGLKLIDVATPDDVSIETILVNEGRATYSPVQETQ